MGPYEIKLGEEVRDLTTGFSGIAINSLEHLNGNVMYCLQPKMPEGSPTYPDAITIDYHLLDVIGPGISERATPLETTPIQLGDVVRDTITGYTGTATTRANYLNGCVRFWVEPKWDGNREGRRSESCEYFDHGRLEVVTPVKKPDPAPTLTKETGLDAPKAEAPKAAEKPAKPSGGPAMRTPAMRAPR